jgi:predicted MFS family arabinose efflux permease
MQPAQPAQPAQLAQPAQSSQSPAQSPLHLPHPIAARPAWLVILAAGTIVGMAMGLRQVMGLYLKPVTVDLGIGREPFSNAMAWANLIWGVAAIFAGGVADKFGAGRVVFVCALCTVFGLLAMMSATSPSWLYLSGVLTGLGVAGTSVSALVGAVGRTVPSEKRLAAIASLGMAAGIGQLIMFPLTHVLIEYTGWKGSLAILAGIAMLMLPLALSVAGKPPALAANVKSQSLMEAVREAASLPSYWLLTLGFFVCGFHLAFYGVHLPAFVSDKGLPRWTGVAALMAVGVTNIYGTYMAGQSGRWVEKRVGLSYIYFMRMFPFLGMLFLPITPATVIIVSALLGLFWLSTVPLTSSLVGLFFGTQWMSMLFGFVFLSHQLGSFTGLWIAGRVYEATQSYDLMWWISIALALAAALIHLPIRERPVARLVAA